MKKIKILVDGHVLDGKHQGTCSYISGIYSELAKNEKCDIYMASEKKSSVENYFPGCPRIKWVPLNTNNKFARLSYEFDRITKEIQPDFCHFQYITPLIKRCRWINTIHDVLFLDFPENFPFKYRVQNHALFRGSALRSDILLTVSEYSKVSISKHFNILPKKIIVTPNAVDDIMSIEPKPIIDLENEQFFVYVSRIEPRKNQHTLINAFLQADLGANFKLVIVGSPSLKYPEFQEQMRTSSQVIHLQGIEKSELVWLYRNSVAAFYPSKCEGFGIPPLEASSLGCLSFCANNTALSELQPYVSGVFENDIDTISQLLKESAFDRIKSDNDIPEAISKKYNWKHSANILFDALLHSK